MNTKTHSAEVVGNFKQAWDRYVDRAIDKAMNERGVITRTKGFAALPKDLQDNFADYARKGERVDAAEFKAFLKRDAHAHVKAGRELPASLNDNMGNWLAARASRLPALSMTQRRQAMSSGPFDISGIMPGRGFEIMPQDLDEVPSGARRRIQQAINWTENLSRIEGYDVRRNDWTVNAVYASETDHRIAAYVLNADIYTTDGDTWFFAVKAYAPNGAKVMTEIDEAP